MRVLAYLLFPSLLIAVACTEPRHSSRLPSRAPQVISTGGSAPRPSYPHVTASTADSDRAIESQIHQSLANGQLEHLASRVTISAANGTVTLRGTVPTAEDRLALDTLVRNTTGVNNVIDQIRVSPAVAESSTTAPAPIVSEETDRTLEERIRQALRNDLSTAPLAQDILVSVQDGIATLTGNVPTEPQKRIVHDLVRTTTGVRSVYDQMRVAFVPTGRTAGAPSRTYSTPPAVSAPTASAASVNTGEIFNLHVQGLNETDRNLAQQILQGLRTDATLASLLPTVNININGGRVILQGVVQSEQQKQSIGAVVQRAAGTSNVENQLQVSSQEAGN